MVATMTWASGKYTELPLYMGRIVIKVMVADTMSRWDQARIRALLEENDEVISLHSNPQQSRTWVSMEFRVLVAQEVHAIPDFFCFFECEQTQMIVAGRNPSCVTYGKASCLNCFLPYCGKVDRNALRYSKISQCQIRCNPREECSGYHNVKHWADGRTDSL